MSVRVEAVGAQGNPPVVMAFAVQIDGEHLGRLLESAAAMPLGDRSVQKHLREVLTVILTPATSTGGEPGSPEGSSTGGGSTGGAAPTPSAPSSSAGDPVAPPAVDVPLPL